MSKQPDKNEEQIQIYVLHDNVVFILKTVTYTSDKYMETEQKKNVFWLKMTFVKMSFLI